MLFDLRSRGRRTTVRGVYLGLAVLMGGGLILFGVGTGVGGGGLLNAFNGGSSNQSSVVSSAEKSALRATRLRPSDPSAWAQLVQARWTSAGEGSNFSAGTGTFTTSGKRELTKATQAWQQYLTLTSGKDPASIAVLAARAYAGLADYSGQASAWEVETAANPDQVKGYECLAVSAYAAKQNRKGDLALDKALTMVPKVQRTLLKQQLQQAKAQPQLAQQC
jgi:hypothetical protein